MNIFIVGVGMGDTKYLTKIAEEKMYGDFIEWYKKQKGEKEKI